MRLLLATSSYPLHPADGAAAAGLFVRDVATALRDRGVDITVLTQRRPGRTMDDRGISVVRFPWYGRGRPAGSLDPRRGGDIVQGASLLASGSVAMIRRLRKGGFDRVIAFWAVPAGAWALACRVAYGVPYDCWALGADIWRSASHPVLGEVVRRVLGGAERAFADGEDLARRAGEIAGREVAYLPSVRRPPVAPPVPPPGRNRFVFLGRWEPAKGADLLPAAAGILLRQGWDLEMEIWGGGSLGHRMGARIARRGIGSRVHLRGWADPLRVPEILASADWVVIPSREESVPLVLQDAIGAGRPVIATDVGDLGRTVRRLGAGVVVDRPTAEDLARGMAEAIRSGGRVRPPGDSIEEVIETLLSGSRGPAGFA